jgi:hypothetical protein
VACTCGGTRSAQAEELPTAVGVRSGHGTERQRCGHTRAVLGGQRSVIGAEADGGVGESSMTVVGRGGNLLLLRTDSERIRRTERWLHAVRVDAGRQVGTSERRW